MSQSMAALTADQISARAEALPLSERAPLFLVALRLEVAEEQGDTAGVEQARLDAAEMLGARGGSL